MASPRKHVQAMWKHLESGASKPQISETAASLGPVIRAFRHHSMFGLSPLGLIACIISVLFSCMRDLAVAGFVKLIALFLRPMNLLSLSFLPSVQKTCHRSLPFFVLLPS